MRKVALVDYGKLELQENCGDIKTLEPGTVKIDVTACSICGSDIALYRGKRSLENERYFGHEFSGVVVDPGDGANGIKKYYYSPLFNFRKSILLRYYALIKWIY